MWIIARAVRSQERGCRVRGFIRAHAFAHGHVSSHLIDLRIGAGKDWALSPETSVGTRVYDIQDFCCTLTLSFRAQSAPRKCAS